MVSQENNMRQKQQDDTITSVPLPHPLLERIRGRMRVPIFSGKWVSLGCVSGRFPEKLLGWYSETGLSRGCNFGHKSASYNTATTVVNRYSEIGFGEVLSHSKTRPSQTRKPIENVRIRGIDVQPIESLSWGKERKVDRG